MTNEDISNLTTGAFAWQTRIYILHDEKVTELILPDSLTYTSYSFQSNYWNGGICVFTLINHNVLNKDLCKVLFTALNSLNKMAND